MTNDVDDAESVDDPTKTFVESWLQANGVVLEMQVAAAFRARLRMSSPHLHGEVDLGRTYLTVEPATGEMKRRETDVVVQVTRRTYSNVYLSLWLVVECKSSAKEPWVLYRSAGRLGSIPQRITETGWEVRAVDGLNLANIGGWLGTELSASNRRPCYAASSTNTKDGGNQRNHARDAMLQVMGAVRGVADDVRTEHDHMTAVILMPVIVTAAPLFAVSLTDEGTPHVERTTHEVITARFGPDDADDRQVWIVNVDWLGDLVDEFFFLAKNLEYRA